LPHKRTIITHIY